MYSFPYHKAENDEVIEDFILQHPFAFISGCDKENRPVATQLPVFLEERNGQKVLRGHLMKNTDHHQAFITNHNVLVVFSSRHTYVSGTWYSNPHTPSTWNYMSVQIKGIMRFLEDKALEDVLAMTTLHFEDHNKDSPTIFENLPKDYMDRLMKMIVAFEIEIEEIDSVFKLSQDRDEESYINIIAQLKKQDSDGRFIASEMEKRLKGLFDKE